MSAQSQLLLRAGRDGRQIAGGTIRIVVVLSLFIYKEQVIVKRFKVNLSLDQDSQF